MHLIIYFNGTEDDGASLYGTYRSGFDYINPLRVKTLIVSGCHHKDVCNSIVFPNLSKFAKRFVTKLFSATVDGQLKIASTQLNSLKIGIDTASTQNSSFDTTDEAITAITLSGYSRGAVTCFNVAKELHKIAPNIPVNIVANQPVPGNIYQWPCSNVSEVADCSHLSNLQHVNIILGSYTGEKIQGGMSPWLHRLGYSQMVPKLPNRKSCKRKLIVIHRRHHVEPALPENQFLGDKHLHVEIANLLNMEHPLNILGMPNINLHAEYHSDSQLPTHYQIQMPNQNNLQTFFGLKRSAAYQHLDPAMPRPHLNEGMKKSTRASYTEWWHTQDKHASLLSSALTKQLVQQIHHTDKNPNNIESLKALYHQAQHWLALKNGTKTSRYYQVTALRDNLYLDLINRRIHPNDLFEEHYLKTHSNRHLLHQWNTLSTKASRFKSFETLKLDREFRNHSLEKPGQHNDKMLLIAIDQWLNAKEGGTSKRYELVVHFRTLINTMMERRYPQNREVQLRCS